ncbi:hypothetical protein [Streptomyces sp. NPDC056132]|uniref:hypothetical protein n=1 Tax=Streptomyces sp. NPDC056132 TaxID=3345722 RepID=UPI0035E0462E
MTCTTAQPRAGIIDDIEREDDSKGYEPESDARVDAVLALALNIFPAHSGCEVAA